MNALATMVLGGVAAALTVSGCAAMNGTRPGDMTVAEHEAAAKLEAKQSEDAARSTQLVSRGPQSRQVAAQHRQLAEEHAKAAELSRAEVASACAGVARPASLGAVRVDRVAPIRERDGRSLAGTRGYYPERLKGARIEIAAPQGEAPSLARAISCEAARESAGLAADAPRSPFALRTAKVSAAPTGAGVVVEIRTPDEDDAAEIVQRAEALAIAAPRTQ